MIEPLIERNLALLPAWLQGLYVKWNAEAEGGTGMMCNVDEPHRLFRLIVCPSTFDTENQAERYIRHEFMHAYTSPICDAGQEGIKDILGPDHPTPGSRAVDTRLLEACERATTDLEALVCRLMGIL